jgi:thioesterase domain-containing protein
VLYTLNLHRYYAPNIPGVQAVPQDTLRRVWGALYKARERYRPSGRYNGKVVLVNSDRMVEWVGHYYDDPHKGWDEWTSVGVQTFSVPAAHMEFFKDDNIDRLAGQIRQVLAEVRQETK